MSMEDKLKDLLERTRELTESPAATRRREELVEEATEAGYSRQYADLAYDIADDVGLDPALAFAVVLSEVRVRDLDGAPDDQWAELQVEAPPPWVNAEVVDPEEAARERELRTTFRRLRECVDQNPTTEDAVREFYKAPDVD